MYSAHGLGGGADLPIPASYAITGGTVALVVSFVILAVAWRRPRFDTPRTAREVPGLTTVVDSTVFRGLLQAAGLALFAFTVWAALAGPDVLVNPTFGIVYVWLWVGIVPTSLLFGRFYRAVSPVRTLHLGLCVLLRMRPAEGLRSYPARLGYWPAATFLLAFVWLELVYPGSVYLGGVRIWFGLYVAAMLVGALVFGDRWFERADPFEVYSSLVARLSVWTRSADGRLTVVSPLRNLASIVPEPGLVAVTAVLLGSTAWDSLRESPGWLRLIQSTALDTTLLGTGMLVVTVSVVGVVFTLATTLTALSVGTTTASTSDDRVPRRALAARLAHSVIPIVIGYVVAHYLTLFVEYGQTTLIQVSDPMADGSDLFGTADAEVNYWWSRNPDLLASTKVAAIVLGHIVGAVAAHDRTLRLLPRTRHVLGQIPLLLAMVAYTFFGLYLLFGV